MNLEAAANIAYRDGALGVIVTGLSISRNDLGFDIQNLVAARLDSEVSQSVDGSSFMIRTSRPPPPLSTTPSGLVSVPIGVSSVRVT